MIHEVGNRARSHLNRFPGVHSFSARDSLRAVGHGAQVCPCQPVLRRHPMQISAIGSPRLTAARMNYRRGVLTLRWSMGYRGSKASGPVRARSRGVPISAGIPAFRAPGNGCSVYSTAAGDYSPLQPATVRTKTGKRAFRALPRITGRNGKTRYPMSYTVTETSAKVASSSGRISSHFPPTSPQPIRGM